MVIEERKSMRRFFGLIVLIVSVVLLPAGSWAEDETIDAAGAEAPIVSEELGAEEEQTELPEAETFSSSPAEETAEETDTETLPLEETAEEEEMEAPFSEEIIEATEPAIPPIPSEAPTEETSGDVSPSPPEEVVDENYIIGSGDILLISEWRNEDLTMQVTVLPDGIINFPLIGALPAAGKTVGGLKKEIEEKLTPYVPEPVVSVTVQTVNSLIIYVIGKVNRPGMFPLNSDVTVLQALAMAGGLTLFADKNDIKILRKNGDSTQVLKFNYKKVSKGKKLEQNIVLQRGDVIVVP